MLEIYSHRPCLVAQDMWSIKHYLAQLGGANLAISVQVGVEAGTPFTVGGHVHQGRHIWVILRKVDIKQETASIVGGTFWAWCKQQIP